MIVVVEVVYLCNHVQVNLQERSMDQKSMLLNIRKTKKIENRIDRKKTIPIPPNFNIYGHAELKQLIVVYLSSISK